MNCSKGERYAHRNNRLKSYGDHNRGDCGIEISNLQQSDFGVWKCRVQRVRQECTDSLLLKCVWSSQFRAMCDTQRASHLIRNLLYITYFR